jgi:hypothetical protein
MSVRISLSAQPYSVFRAPADLHLDLLQPPLHRNHDPSVVHGMNAFLCKASLAGRPPAEYIRYGRPINGKHQRKSATTRL